MDARETTRTIPLFDRSGMTLDASWARHPYFAYNRQMLRRSFSALREWDHYIIIDPGRSYIIDLDLMDGNWRTFCSITFTDLSLGQSRGIRSSRGFSNHRLDLSTSSALDSQATYQDKDNSLTLTFMKRTGCRYVIFNAPSLVLPDGSVGLLGDFTISQDEDGDSMNFLFQERDQRRRSFVLGEKVIGMKVDEGFIRRGGHRDDFAQGGALAVLDWGRGLIPGHRDWRGASATAVVAGHVMGFNLGYAGDGIQNALFIDGRMTKLPQVVFSGDDDMVIRSGDGTIEVTFRALSEDLVQPTKDLRQIYGMFSGHFTAEDGHIISFSDMIGWVEIHRP